MGNGNVTHLPTDKTIGKTRGNLNRMKYVKNPLPPHTPQEMRRRASRKKLANTGRVDPEALKRDAEIEQLEKNAKAKKNR